MLSDQNLKWCFSIHLKPKISAELLYRLKFRAENDLELEVE